MSARAELFNYYNDHLRKYVNKEKIGLTSEKFRLLDDEGNNLDADDPIYQDLLEYTNGLHPWTNHIFILFVVLCVMCIISLIVFLCIETKDIPMIIMIASGVLAIPVGVLMFYNRHLNMKTWVDIPNRYVKELENGDKLDFCKFVDLINLRDNDKGAACIYEKLREGKTDVEKAMEECDVDFEKEDQRREANRKNKSA